MNSTRQPMVSKKGDEWAKKASIVLHLDALLYNRPTSVVFHSQQIKKSAVRAYLPRFEMFDVSNFGMRVTSISWDQNGQEHYTLGAGDKHGNLLVLKGHATEMNTRVFSPIFQKDGYGPGASILSLKFQTNEDILVAGICGQVQKVNMTKKKEQVFHDTHDYAHWFTSVDFSAKSNTVIAGDTKGQCHLFTADGEPITAQMLHKGKILHCEFNPKMPHLLVTSGLDKIVKLFDLRKFNGDNCLHMFKHNCGCNIAKFSPQDGSRLLTNDQKDEIRIYQGPLWHHCRTINHPHRQFQHLTPIRASWHPLSEEIMIGTFPTEKVPRTVNFYDPDTGELSHEWFSPRNTIASLNEANTLGDVVASGSGYNLMLWEPRRNEMEVIKHPVVTVSSALRALLRGEGPSSSRGRKRGLDVNDDDVSRRTASGAKAKKTKSTKKTQ